MNDTVIAICTMIGQLGFAAAAYRLSRKTDARVDGHEVRLRVLEKTR